MALQFSQLQRNWEEGLYKVRMYALKPRES